MKTTALIDMTFLKPAGLNVKWAETFAMEGFNKNKDNTYSKMHSDLLSSSDYLLEIG